MHGQITARLPRVHGIIDVKREAAITQGVHALPNPSYTTSELLFNRLMYIVKVAKQPGGLTILKA